MHPPRDGKRLPLSVRMKPYIVGGFQATREELRTVLGLPHYVETDSTRTSGGDEDWWGWELPSGARLVVVLQVPYEAALLHCDPPEPDAVVEALGIDVVANRWEALAIPVVRPDYSGP